MPIEKLPEILGFEKFDSMIEILEVIAKKNTNVYLDRDTLIGAILDEIDRKLADKQDSNNFAYGGGL